MHPRVRPAGCGYEHTESWGPAFPLQGNTDGPDVSPAHAADTVYTEAFANGWPNAPHRCLRASVEAALAFPGEIVGQNVHGLTGERFAITRLRPLVIHTGVTGELAAMPHWAGESVDGVNQVQTAAEIIQELMADAEVRLRRWR